MPLLSDTTARVFSNVELSDDAVLEDYVLVGKPPQRGEAAPEITRIGSSVMLRSHSVIYAGCVIGDRFQCGHHVTIREGTHIGDDVSIGTGCVIEHHVVIHHGVRMHSNVFVPEFSILHENCWLGPNVVLTNAKYPRSRNVKEQLIGPTIMPGAKIGANATILPGVTVGRDSLVGAGSVVVRDVPDLTVVAGNPARIIKGVNELPYDLPA